MKSNRGRGVSILFHSCSESHRQEHSSFAPKATSTLQYQLRLAGPSLVQPCQPIHQLLIVMYLPWRDSNIAFLLVDHLEQFPTDENQEKDKSCRPRGDDLWREEEKETRAGTLPVSKRLIWKEKERVSLSTDAGRAISNPRPRLRAFTEGGFKQSAKIVLPICNRRSF
jgi:hypothetical protein